MRRAPSTFKWRWLLLWWAGQGVVLYLLWMLLAAESLGGIVAVFTQPPPRDAIAALAVGIGAVTALQAGALLPLRAPGRSETWRGRLLRHGTAGLAIGMMVGLACWLPLMYLAEGALEIHAPGVWTDVALWTPGLLSAVVATAMLWRRGGPTPLWLSGLTAGFLIAVLLVSLGFAIAGVIEEYTDLRLEWSVLVIALALLPGWAVATPLVLAFLKRGAADSQWSRLSSRILLGTVIEAAAVIPLDVMVRRKTSCYCLAGTYWALVFMGAVALCALGPVVLLAPAGRRRRRLREGRCEVCGYDMRGLQAGRCPECGAGWRGGDESRE